MGFLTGRLILFHNIHPLHGQPCSGFFYIVHMLLDIFLEYLQLERHYSPHTIKAYGDDIGTFFAFAKAEYDITYDEDVNYAMVRRWIVNLAGAGVSNRSINRKVSSLKSYYKFLQKIEAVDVSPLQKHKSFKIKKKVDAPFSREEIDNVLSGFEDSTDFCDLRDRLMIELFYGTGMRRSELINLKIMDVDFSNGTIKVLGKRNKERLVPLLPFLKKSITQYLETRHKDWGSGGPSQILLNDKGVKMSDSFVYRKINDYFSKVSHKVKKSPHMLRHTFATHLLNNGADLNAVKELLGHTSLAATQVYTHNSIAGLSQVHKKAHPRNKKQ